MKAVFSGTLLVLCMPPFDLAPLAWIALWPILDALDGRRLAARLALGTICGAVWSFGTVLPWLYPASLGHLTTGAVAAAGLSLGAAWLYGGVYMWVLAIARPWLPSPFFLSFPAFWVLLEWVRGEIAGGAPWALLGHSQHALLPVAQLAHVTGVLGVSFVVAISSAALACRESERLVGLAVGAVALVASAVYGSASIAALDATAPATRTAVVDAVSGFNLAPDALATYTAETRTRDRADLTVWPESALPAYLQDRPAEARALAKLAREHGALLIGALRYDGPKERRRYLNSSVLLDADGVLRATYTKARLVPFAERSPWPFPSFVPRPLSSGPAGKPPATVGPLRVGTLICWESIFGDPARRYANLGVDVLANLTSDLDLRSGVPQHLAFSIFRSIETRRWLVRASGIGETIWIDPTGRVHHRDRVEVPLEHAPPGPFVRFGDTVVLVSLALLSTLLWRARRTANGRAHFGANESSH